MLGDKPQGPSTRRWWGAVAGFILVLSACQAEQPAPEAEQGEPAVLRVGWVSAIDQIGLPVALDLGFFEEHEIDVELLEPFPTGVDALNALAAGEADIVQVGTPSFGAILGDIDLVYTGNYTGSSVQLGIDQTMAMVARRGSGIDADDLSTLGGKKVGVSIGSINHLYVLAILGEEGISPDEVELVDVPPPDMPITLETGSVDAAAFWDPWPIIALKDVEGTYEVVRGGGFIAFIGYQVALREWVAENTDLLQRYLAARAQADQWMRQNPDEAAEVAVRWVPGTEPEVAQEAMQFNIEQLDPRFSKCNYLAAHVSQQLLVEVGALEEPIDVRERFEAGSILEVMEGFPQYFEDLQPIPEEAQIDTDYQFDQEDARAACE